LKNLFSLACRLVFHAGNSDDKLQECLRRMNAMLPYPLQDTIGS